MSEKGFNAVILWFCVAGLIYIGGKIAELILKKLGKWDDKE